MRCEKKQCTASNEFTFTRTKKKLGFIAGLLLVLLPKCPFCVMAFSSTFILCGEAGTFTTAHTYTSSTTFLLTLLFCGITLIGLIFNYRDIRTKYAILLALAGSLCILFSVTSGGGLALYYSGVLFIFTGVWLNGSLLFFIAKIRAFFSQNSGNKPVEFK
ncbi:hypothetical protein A3860_23240 [Niastella vici]|uniref:MerC mercury resistance protein n=1 Tax=Niastella vici TaxID=1703345 RepID=A0A1V9FZQ7_9BACT|nr:hypothetical protein A3860_23240 [Niastella vici]